MRYTGSGADRGAASSRALAVAVAADPVEGAGLVLAGCKATDAEVGSEDCCAEAKDNDRLPGSG